MKRIFALTGASLVAIALIGCPMNVSQRSQVAQALHQTSIVLMDAQQAEIIIYTQGVIPAEDHVFIEKEFVAVAEVGKTTDGCVLTAQDTTTCLLCLKNELGTIDQIQSQGAIGLKSDKAKSTYNSVMLSIRAVVQGIYTSLGGK